MRVVQSLSVALFDRRARKEDPLRSPAREVRFLVACLQVHALLPRPPPETSPPELGFFTPCFIILCLFLRIIDLSQIPCFYLVSLLHSNLLVNLFVGRRVYSDYHTSPFRGPDKKLIIIDFRKLDTSNLQTTTSSTTSIATGRKLQNLSIPSVSIHCDFQNT